jgi:hypothetical protein
MKSSPIRILSRDKSFIASPTSKPIPVRIAQIAGEIIHTLRSTLDHLAYQLLLTANPNAPEKERSRVDFPIYDTAKQTGADAFKKVQPLGVRAIDAIRKVKPYKGGNDLLWAISVLDNINKHRTLLFASVAHGKMDIASESKPTDNMGYRWRQECILPVAKEPNS